MRSRGDDFANLDRARVLFVGVGAPWKGGAGYLVRQNMFLHALAECARLDLALMGCPPGELPPALEGMVTALPMPGSKCESRGESLARDLLSKLPRVFRQSDVDAIRERVAALHPERFDAVFAYRVDFGHFAGVLNHPRLMLDVDDPEHLRRRERFQVMGNGSVDWRSRLDLARLARFEQRAVKHAMAAFVCQHDDQRAFDEPRPLIVPNCVDVPAECPPRLAETPTVLFVGNLQGSDQAPNVDALRWLLDEIWPLIVREEPKARLEVVGAMSEQVRRMVEAKPQAAARGFVQHLPDAFAHASLSIAPIRFGTGTRIKILESMAWGCPVVSTPKGCQGLGVEHGRDILIGDSPSEFARHCIALLRDPGRQQLLSQAAFRLVATQYDRKQVHRELVPMLRRIIEGELRDLRRAEAVRTA